MHVLEGEIFTRKTVSLNEVAEFFGINVIRDCNFAYAAKVPTRLPARLVSCAEARHIDAALSEDGIAGIVTTNDLVERVPEHLGAAISDKPISAVLDIHEDLARRANFQWETFESRIHPTAFVHPSAVVAPHDVVLGEGCVVSANAVICPRSIVGRFCNIGPGTVVGGDAFEVNTTVSPRRILVQSGGVWLGDHVEIQSKCTIIRSTFGGYTEIGDESKFDCQIYLAHDCIVGRRVRIAGCAAVSGRVMIGDDVYIGPNASISNGITIGAGATVSIGSVVTRSVSPGQRVTGNFALAHDKWLNFIRSVR